MPQPRSRTEHEAPAIAALERPDPGELDALYVALGWGHHSLEVLRSSIAAYTATVCARTPAGLLVGYASVFSDRCLTTMFGEFVVHPGFQRKGIGKTMMLAVEKAFPSAPIYVQALGESRAFYAALGFRTPSTPLTCMFRRPERSRRTSTCAGTDETSSPINARSAHDRHRIVPRAHSPM